MPDTLLLKMPVACVQCHGHKATAKAFVHAGLWEQVKAFFEGLFNTGDWPARWHCGTWTDFHGWLYIISDLLIWGSYFAIPLLLFRIVARRKDIPYPKVFGLFIAFILLCGTTHFVDAVIFWWPAYRLSALLRFATGLVSVTAVVVLYKIMPSINNLRTLAQLEAEIEERKKAEQEAKHLQLMQETTQELMKKKDEFMSIASHELKTPITSAKASLQVVQRMVAKNEDLQPVARFVDKAATQVNKLTSLVNDLLDVTKIQAGKLELVKSRFLMHELITDCVEHCVNDEGKHTVIMEGDKSLYVEADKNRIDQVLCNLLTNAIKYSPQSNRVVITLEQTKEGKTKVCITDEGIGIPQDKLGEVFNRFFRVEHTSQNFSGLGLGLFISSEIIKQHNGEIGVNSTFGKGSTFWFTI